MEVKINKLPKSQIEFKIEMPAEEFNRFIEQAILNLSKKIEIKGFRKGKAPKDVIEKEVGSEKVLIEAADLAVKENYRRAVLENKIEVISQPEIEIQKLARGNSFVFLVKTSVLPEIKLPDYKKIAVKVKKKEIVVKEKDIEGALKWLQKSRAKFTLKNEPAQKGDFVEIEYYSSQVKPNYQNFGVETNQKIGQKDAFILGEGHFVPGFEEKIIGMRTGEEKEEIPVTIPENRPTRESAGKKIFLKVKIKSVQKVEFPEVNDQFAKNLGQFENLVALKRSIKKGLNLEKEQAESQRARNEILEKISETTKCEIPEILVEKEQKQRLENIKRDVSKNLKISFDDYLNKIKKNEKELLNSFLPEAKIRIKKFLVLREIGKREKVEVSKEEVSEEVKKTLKRYPNTEEAQKNLDPVKSSEAGIPPKAELFNGVDLEKLKEYTKEVIKNEKTFQLLESFVG